MDVAVPTYIELDAVAFLPHAVTAISTSASPDRVHMAIEAFFKHWEDKFVQGDQRRRRLLMLRERRRASYILTKKSPERIIPNVHLWRQRMKEMRLAWMVPGVRQ